MKFIWKNIKNLNIKILAFEKSFNKRKITLCVIHYALYINFICLFCTKTFVIDRNYETYLWQIKIQYTHCVIQCCIFIREIIYLKNLDFRKNYFKYSELL